MVNTQIILGRLGKDPEVRYSNNGGAIVNFNVASNHRYKNKAGEKVDETAWHKCVAFGKTAEICGEYLKKGSLVHIMGRTQTREWKDKDDNKRFTTEVIIEKMQMVPQGPSKPAEKTGIENPYNDSNIPDDVPF